MWSAKWFRCPHCWSALTFSGDELVPAASGDPGENSPIMETPEARLEREKVASRHSRILVIAGAAVVLVVDSAW